MKQSLVTISYQDVIIATLEPWKYVKNASNNECICYKYVPKNVHQTPYIKLNYENKNVWIENVFWTFQKNMCLGFYLAWNIQFNFISALHFELKKF